MCVTNTFPFKEKFHKLCLALCRVLLIIINKRCFYSLVQDKGGFYGVLRTSDWREIYSDLGIPKITQAAGHHAKMAYTKYLLSYEEYMTSFQCNKEPEESPSKSGSKKSGKLANKMPRSTDETNNPSRRTSRRRKISESLSVADENEVVSSVKEHKRLRKCKVVVEKRDSDHDDASSNASSEKSTSQTKSPAAYVKSETKQGRRRSNSGIPSYKKHHQFKINDKVKVKYGKESIELYTAKVVDFKVDENNKIQYLVHYAGWNSRHDEWVKPWKITGLISDTSNLPKTPIRAPKTPTLVEEKPECLIAPSTPVDTSPCLVEITPPSIEGGEEAKEKLSSLAKAFQDKNITEKKKKRIRRRSTSSSTPPPSQSPSTKRASSVEKCVPEKSDTKHSLKEEPVSGDEKPLDKNSVVPAGIFPPIRRTSGRRSISPAYLKESTLYGMTKRRRNNSAVSEPQSSADGDPVQDADDLSSESSSKSSNSSTSEAARSSPLTVWTEAEQQKLTEKSKKPERKRARRKSGDKKLVQIDEEDSHSALLRSAAYDDFDDDVPSIELERSNTETGKKSSVDDRVIGEKMSDGADSSETNNQESSKTSENNNESTENKQTSSESSSDTPNDAITSSSILESRQSSDEVPKAVDETPSNSKVRCDWFDGLYFLL